MVLQSQDAGLVSMIESLSLTDNIHDDVTERFPSFVHDRNVGTFAWEPISCTYKSVTDITAKDVRECLRSAKVLSPPVIKRYSDNHVPPRTSFVYKNELPDDDAFNAFPRDPGVIGALSAAVTDFGLDLEEIDFVMGGSTLDILANGILDKDLYMAQTISIPRQDQPPHYVTVIKNKKSYVCSSRDVGFQFERFVTGGNFEDVRGGGTTVYTNMHIMNIGSHRVLFCAEIDAIAPNTAPFARGTSSIVEVKASNPRYWGQKTMFQMISSNAQFLVHAQKRGMSLTGMILQRRDQVMDKHTLSERALAEERILKNINELKHAVREHDKKKCHVRVTEDGSEMHGDEKANMEWAVSSPMSLTFVNGTIGLSKHKSRIGNAPKSAQRSGVGISLASDQHPDLGIDAILPPAAVTQMLLKKAPA